MQGSAAEAGLSDEQSVEEYVASLMRKLDVNQDGKVAEQEFYVLFADMRQMIGSDSRFDRMLDAVLKECSEGNQHEVLTTLAILDDQ